MNHEETVRLTEDYGGQWGINHTRRLLHLIGLIADGRDYDREAIWLAAHLHDWGAYGAWAQPGVDHALRSRQVAEAFLEQGNCPPTLAARVLPCFSASCGASGTCRSFSRRCKAAGQAQV